MSCSHYKLAVTGWPWWSQCSAESAPQATLVSDKGVGGSWGETGATPEAAAWTWQTSVPLIPLVTPDAAQAGCAHSPEGRGPWSPRQGPGVIPSGEGIIRDPPPTPLLLGSHPGLQAGAGWPGEERTQAVGRGESPKQSRGDEGAHGLETVIVTAPPGLLPPQHLLCQALSVF